MTWVLFLVPSSMTLGYLISGLVTYDLTLLFLVLSDMTWLPNFWSCHLWLDSLISGLVLCCLDSLSRIPLISNSGISTFSSHYIPSGVLRTRSSFFWRASGSNSRDQITLLQVSLWIQQSSLLMSYLHCQAYCLATFTIKPTDGLPSLASLLMGYFHCQNCWWATLPVKPIEWWCDFIDMYACQLISLKLNQISFKIVFSYP